MDSNATFALPVESSLKAKGFAVHFFSSTSALFEWLPGRVVPHKAVLVASVASSENSILLSTLQRRFPALPAILAIEKPCVATAVELMRCGAAYVLHRPFTGEQLERTIRHIENGIESASDAESASGTAPAGSGAVYERLKSLSPRQKEILVNVFEGRINKVIAYRLGISIKTVELHRSRMMQKMQASSAVELIKMTLPHSEELRKQASA